MCLESHQKQLGAWWTELPDGRIALFLPEDVTVQEVEELQAIIAGFNCCIEFWDTKFPIVVPEIPITCDRLQSLSDEIGEYFDFPIRGRDLFMN